MRMKLVEHAPVVRAEGGRYYSVHQGATMALRACIGSTAASRMGMLYGSDVHRSEISEWKVKLHSALANASRRFHTDLRDHTDLCEEDIT